MSVLKYKDASGKWVEATSFNQVVGVANVQEWKEIEVYADTYGEFDCSAAGIDLLESENWILCASGVGVNDSNNSSFHAVAANNPQALFISPIIAKLKGEDMSDSFKRIGVYTLAVDGYGYKGFGYSYYLLFDSNKIFAVAFAVCSFLWFKNMNIQYSKIINAFGAGTFGVLLIHANSTAMRTWLWKDTVDSVGHYNMPLYSLFLYSIGVVLVIFVTCNLIDQLRIATLEKWFFKWYDKKYATKIDSFVNGFIVGN
jgi:hypothetical protein